MKKDRLTRSDGFGPDTLAMRAIWDSLQALLPGRLNRVMKLSSFRFIRVKWLGEGKAGSLVKTGITARGLRYSGSSTQCRMGIINGSSVQRMSSLSVRGSRWAPRCRRCLAVRGNDVWWRGFFGSKASRVSILEGGADGMRRKRSVTKQTPMSPNEGGRTRAATKLDGPILRFPRERGRVSKS